MNIRLLPIILLFLAVNAYGKTTSGSHATSGDYKPSISDVIANAPIYTSVNQLPFFSIGFGLSSVTAVRDSDIYKELNIDNVIVQTDQARSPISGYALTMSIVEDFDDNGIYKFTLDYYIATETIKNNDPCNSDKYDATITCDVFEEDHEIRFSIAKKIYGVRSNYTAINVYTGISTNKKIKYIKESATGYKDNNIYEKSISNTSIAIFIDMSYKNILLSYYKYIDVTEIQQNNIGKSSGLTVGLMFNF